MISLDANNLLVYLPFDVDATLDLCGGQWFSNGQPSIVNHALHLQGDSYIALDDSITLGGQDFTICGRATMDASTAQQWAGLFALNGNKLRIIRYNALNNAVEIGYKDNLARINLSFELTSQFFFEIDYQHSTGKWLTFFNGTLVHSYTNALARTIYNNVFIGTNGDNSKAAGTWGGTIDEFMIFDGVALHTDNFTPPTDDDYFNLKMELGAPAKVVADFDVETTILNSLKGWRVYNRGFAELLATGGTTVRDSSKSTTGVAFWGGEKSDMFHTPSGLKEIWLRFDLFVENYSSYTNGNHRLEVGHYSPTQSTFCGLLSTFDAGNWVLFDHLKPTGATSAITIERNVLNKFLMHLKSDATDGLVEVFVNGSTTKYTYSGNVNGGEDLDNLRMFCPNAYVLFSNVIVSETELTLDDGYCRADFAVETRIAAPQLAARYQGATHLLPLQTKKVSPALAVRVADKNFYNPLVATDAANASDLRIFLDEQAFALTGGDSFD